MCKSLPIKDCNCFLLARQTGELFEGIVPLMIKSMSFGTLLEHALWIMFGYRDIAYLSYGHNGGRLNRGRLFLLMGSLIGVVRLTSAR